MKQHYTQSKKRGISLRDIVFSPVLSLVILLGLSIATSGIYAYVQSRATDVENIASSILYSGQSVYAGGVQK